MWFKIPAIFFAWCLVIPLAFGCGGKQHYQKVHSPRSMYVPKLPPDQKRETVPARPSKAHVWIEGSWYWSTADENWMWKQGVWREPPKPGYQWKAPTYDERREQVIVYTPGYWVAKKAATPTAKE